MTLDVYHLSLVEEWVVLIEVMVVCDPE